MDLGMAILIALPLIGLIGVVAIMVRREQLTRRLSEHHGPEHGDAQSEVRAAAQAAHMGRGGGWPAP